MAAAKKKTWLEKLKERHDLPKVMKIKGKMTRKWGTGTVAIPAPIEIDEIMRKVPKGKVITINEIRKKIAKKHKATIGCPITSGIFARIAAGAAEEQKKEGKKRITPYWCTLRGDGELNEKYPGGVAGQKKLLEKEGHRVVKKGKKYVVEDYEKSLVRA
jgi:alkylated DNA nucleotide flippase Atl1